MKLKFQLPKLMDIILVNNSYCNHLDFLASLKVNEHVNDPIKNILQKTDSVDWLYSAPSQPEEAKNGGEHENVTSVDLWSPSPSNNQQFESGMEYFKKHLGDTLVSTMLHHQTSNDSEMFKREREQQKILTENLNKIFKSALWKHSQLEGGSTSEFSTRPTASLIATITRDG